MTLDIRQLIDQSLPGYGTFSGGDMLLSIVFPGSSPYAVGEASTISYSTNREVGEVRTLGRISVKGFTRGQRIVAGTIVFTVFNQHMVNSLKERVRVLQGIKGLLTDELPPFDIVVTFASEYGRSARLVIYGVIIYEEGKVLSVEDLFTENIWSYVARDIVLMDSAPEAVSPMISPSTVLNDQSKEAVGKFTVSDLLPERMAEAGTLEHQRFLEELAKQYAMRDILSKQLSRPVVAPAPGPSRLPSARHTLAGLLPVSKTVEAPFSALAFQFQAGLYRDTGDAHGEPVVGHSVRWTAEFDVSKVLPESVHGIVLEAKDKVYVFPTTTGGDGTTTWQFSPQQINWIRQLPERSVLRVRCEVTEPGISTSPALWSVTNKLG